MLHCAIKNKLEACLYLLAVHTCQAPEVLGNPAVITLIAMRCIAHGDRLHGLAGDIQIFTAIYRVCQQAAQPSMEPYDTCKQRFGSLLQPAGIKA